MLKFVLIQTTKLCAPFIPFLSERIYQELGMEKSVHLDDWPEVDKKMINSSLEEEMNIIRETASLGLSIRNQTGIKVRQPLSELKICANGKKVSKQSLDILLDELNVKTITEVLELKEEQGWSFKESGNIKISFNLYFNE